MIDTPGRCYRLLPSDEFADLAGGLNSNKTRRV